ncbi:MAG: IS630 family transposase, partial [Ancalomicrobiaceae bacterium]|nr:IS630 family transposase [Ancalomicrobiaceae bacterium]
RHRDEDVQLWFEDGEAGKRSLRWSDRRPNRVGQKGRNAHVWDQKGLRPTALTDKRFKSVYVYGAVRPGTDDSFGLILPHADTAMMTLFLDAFSASLAPNVHAILVMDKAGWHVTGRLKVPPNVSLVRLPPYSPELNPVERVWLHLKERYLSHHVFADVPAIVDACAKAWNDLVADKGRRRQSHQPSLPQTGQDFMRSVSAGPHRDDSAPWWSDRRRGP